MRSGCAWHERERPRDRARTCVCILPVRDDYTTGVQQTRPVFRVKRERSERGRVRHRTRRTEEGGEGWLEEGVGTSLTVQPTSYALGPTFRCLLSPPLSFFWPLPLSFVLSPSLSPPPARSLALPLPPPSHCPPSPCSRSLSSTGGKHCIYFEFLQSADPLTRGNFDSPLLPYLL